MLAKEKSMNDFEWIDSRIKKMTWGDAACIELAAFGFALMVAKLWPGLLCLEWYWYGLLWVVAGIRPLAVIFSRE